MAEESATNWFYCVHNKRTDDPSLTYTLGGFNVAAWGRAGHGTIGN